MRRVSLIALLLLSACAPATPAGWTRHDLADGAFSLAVPPGLAREAAQGIDSYVARFVAPDLQVEVDYGRYGGLPPDIAVQVERIGGRAVEIAEREGEIWARFEAPPREGGGGVLEPTDGLVLHIASARPEACEQGREVIRSVRFAR